MKKFISKILICLVFASTVNIQAFATEPTTSVKPTSTLPATSAGAFKGINIAPIKFEKVGEIKTIVNNYNSEFFLVTEYLDTKGQTYSPKTETKITKENFEKYYKGKAYDRAYIKIIVKDSAKSTFLNVVLDKDENIIDSSYAGEVIDGNFSALSVDSTTETYSWILNDKGKYYNVSSNSKTGKAVYSEITNLEYQKAMFDKTYLYSKVITEKTENKVVVHSETMYDQKDNKMGVPTIVKKDDSINVAEMFYVLNAMNAMSANNKDVLYGLDTISSYVKQYNAPTDVKTNSGTVVPAPVTTGVDKPKDPYVLPADLMAKYGDLYSNWMDEYNKGYMGNWMDPYFNGEMAVLDWQDPFWKSTEIQHNYSVDGIALGYYDDAGTYIKLDSDGSPIPSEKGSFDSAGNFKPENSAGYYDPNGIYHPIFDQINGLSYAFNGNLNINNSGYFDINGVWHAKTNDNNQIVLFDGRIVYKNGYIYNPKTTVKMAISLDIWEKYYFLNEVIYSDFSVYDKTKSTLKLADGTVYTGKKIGTYILFGNNDAINLFSLEKGKKDSTGIILSNGGRILDSGVVQYPNGITYSKGEIHLPNNDVLQQTFKDKDSFISVGNYGRIYPNGHVSTLNKYNDLITDIDSVIFADRTMFANGDILKNGKIYQGYRDAKGNLIYPDGYVVNNNLKLGTYNQFGYFVVGQALPAGKNGYYDRLGNLVNFDGSVLSMASDPKNTANKIQISGYYNERGKFVSTFTPTTKSYYTADSTLVNIDNSIVNKDDVYGFYDKTGNFIMNNGDGFFDKKGTFSQASSESYYSISSNGIFYPKSESKFMLTMEGTIKVIGEEGIYDENGLVVRNGDSGYYDNKGVFIIAKENPYISFGYFYDSLQIKHNLGTIYKDVNGVLRLLQNPTLGLSLKDNKIKLVYSELLYDKTGFTTKDGKSGYFNKDSKLIESKVSPYIGGFYDESGMWIDKTYYTDIFGNLIVNHGGFNRMGNYVTPFGDVGSFDVQGKFNLNLSNMNKDFFYNETGTLTYYDRFYVDSLGLYKNISGNEVFDENGNAVSSEKNLGMKMSDYVMLEYGTFINNKGKIGHFDKDSKFILGKPIYKEGFYTPSGGFVKYGTTEASATSANFIFIKNQYYVIYNGTGNTSGILTMADGYSFAVSVIQGKYFTLSNGTTISDTGEVGYMANGVFVSGKINKATTSVLSTGNAKTTKTVNNNYLDLEDKLGYFLNDGTFVLYTGGYGYYEKDKIFVNDALNPYMNGFYNFNGKWVSTDTGNNVANKGYFNKYGMPRNGENPYTLGYYDYEGSLHPFDKNYFITIAGNVIQIGDKAIGYIDSLGLFNLYKDKGYFDVDGTYYIDNEMKGYYTKTGALTKGKNPNFDGFYDMYGNWHLFGDIGYFDANGYYYPSVTDEATGYFNEVGEFTKGYNPYINGYNDINGNWNDIATTPLLIHYEKDGTARVGLNPYKDGYYDMYANWHPSGYKGYFDKHGTYYSVANGSVGYYDAKGNYREGTNPYQHGYYDENANLRLFEHTGYFTKNGTYIDEKGEQWYFLSDKLKKRGENTNVAGFYDMYGNWYPFAEDGYYTPEKLFFPNLLVVDKYKVGSKNYILFEGVFKNPEYVPITSKNTIQFTFNSQSGAPLFVDTGIRISKNAMISYSNARDLLHNIAVYSKSTFIEDNDSCIVIVNGRMINITNNGKMSIKELRDKFLDSKIEITIAKTRIGERFALADSIEAGNNIKISKDEIPYAIKNPLVVQNGAPYISLKDLSKIIVYDIKTNKVDDTRVLTFSLKQNLTESQYKSLAKEIVTKIGDKECLINSTDDNYEYYQLKAPVITRTVESTGMEEIYIPIYMIGKLTGMNVEYNTITYELMLTPTSNNLPFEDN